MFCLVGKPLNESLLEVNFAANFMQWYSEEAKRMNGDVLPNAESNIRRMVLREPVGVCGMITPWNFPTGMIARKVGAALGAGCSTVLRPSEETPLTALAMAKMSEEIGLPAGLFNVVPTSRDSADMAGTLLCESPLIKKISFTGSTVVGKSLYQKSSSTVKRISMELGGNAPCIVFDSADAKLAAMKTVQSRFRNTGQTCVCAERVFVQDGIYEEYLDELKKAVSQLKIGDPLEMETTFSAVINKRGLDRIEGVVDDAKQKGATVVTGGKVLEKGKLYYEPTILADCSTGMRCIDEEIFGPVVPLVRFRNEDEVVAMANADASGLAGYFFSRDFSQIWRVAEQLEVGMVGINEQAISNEMMPFGGVKESGIGREGSVHGLDDYTEYKFICMGI